MNERLQTRVATLEDAGELARFNFSLNKVAEALEVIAARLADPRRVDTPILAELDGRAIGIAAVRIVPSVFSTAPRAELTEILVEEAFRRRGAGRMLLAHAERLAREQGATKLLVLTDFYNHAAQGLYRAMGFENVDIAMIKRVATGETNS